MNRWIAALGTGAVLVALPASTIVDNSCPGWTRRFVPGDTTQSAALAARAVRRS
jgi:hypothetical protein